MQAAQSPTGRRLGTSRRDDEQVRPLELFFDLVFVLALTQCTTLMSDNPSWVGLAQGLLVLGVIWWAWVGYAWLTSVIDPEAGAVRMAMFGATAAFLLVALFAPGAFEGMALPFALAYGAARLAHIVLFVLASPEDPDLRRSVLALAASTTAAVALLAAAATADGALQGALWVLALGLDMAGPYFFGSSGWKLVPGHFAERHGLIVIIALGESIVAIGVGAGHQIDLARGAAAVLGVALSAAMWWAYFDVVALVSARRLAAAPAGRIRNELARDSYSYIHFLLVAGIVLAALGLEETLAEPGAHLHAPVAAGLLGGPALYLLGLVAFRYRQAHTWNRRRLGLGLLLVALVPIATAIPALASLGLVVLSFWILIALDHRTYGEGRARLRLEVLRE